MLYTREKLLELLERYLLLATQGHERLNEVAGFQKKQIASLEQILEGQDEGSKEALSSVLDGFIEAQSMLLDELESSHKKSQELQNELGQAKNEVRLDPLTHIFNRKKLEEDVDRFLSDPPGAQLQLFMLVIDADNFKRINDTHGHLAGDKVLIYLVRAFRSVLLESSQLYRYGGEEFVVLSIHPGEQEAQELAERIRSKVAASQMSYQDRPIELTVSIGISRLKKGDDFDQLFTRADEAMLLAKKSGRNRVERGF
jgi:diguanylate cyclase